MQGVAVGRTHQVLALVVAGLLIVTGCSRAPQSSPRLAAGGWRDFQGTWIAAGTRSTLQLSGNRKVSIADLNGSLVLAGPSRPDVGFRAEALLLDDSDTGLVGRAVWTDERGDQVFSELRTEGGATDKKIHGTFVGGTGRYTGATGTYEFSWQFLIGTEEGNVQGQSSGLNGRIHVEPPRATPDAGGSQP